MHYAESENELVFSFKLIRQSHEIIYNLIRNFIDPTIALRSGENLPDVFLIDAAKKSFLQKACPMSPRGPLVVNCGQLYVVRKFHSLHRIRYFTSVEDREPAKGMAILNQLIQNRRRIVWQPGNQPQFFRPNAVESIN